MPECHHRHARLLPDGQRINVCASLLRTPQAVADRGADLCRACRVPPGICRARSTPLSSCSSPTRVSPRKEDLARIAMVPACTHTNITYFTTIFARGS